MKKGTKGLGREGEVKVWEQVEKGMSWEGDGRVFRTLEGDTREREDKFFFFSFSFLVEIICILYGTILHESGETMGGKAHSSNI